MNGATEATLAELLAVAQAMNANLVTLQRLASQGGGGSSSGGGGSNPVGAMSAASGAASVAIRGLAVAGNLVSGLFSTMGNILGKVIGGIVNTVSNLYNFAKAAANGTAKLSDFYDAFKDLPFFIGTVASLFADIIRYSEGLLVAYQNVTKVGAVFGGNLFELANSAARAYLTVGEFAKVINQGSEIFASMGGRVQSGIELFIAANAKLIGPGSEFSRSILGLGVTAEEASGYLLSVMKSQGVLNKAQSADASQLAAYTKQYIFELDTLSKVTGKRKDQIDAEIKKAEEDQLFQTFLDSLTPDQAQKVKILMAQAETYNGKPAVEQLKATLRGLDTPVGQLSTNLAVASGGISLDGQALRDAVFDSSVSVEQAGKISTQQQLKIAEATGQFYDSIGTMGQAAGVGGQFLSAESQRMARYIKAAGGDFSKALALAADDQKKQGKGTAASLAQAELSIKNFGAQIMGIVTTVIAPFATALITLGESVTGLITTFVGSNGFKETIKSVTGWFSTAFTDIKKAFSEEGFQGALKKFFTKIGEGAENIWKVVGPMWVQTIQPALASFFDKMSEMMSPYLIKAMNFIMDNINEYLYKSTKGVIGEDPTQRKFQRYAEQKAEESNALFERYQKLRELQKSGAAVDEAQLNDLSQKARQSLTTALAANDLYKRYISGDRSIAVPTRHSGTIGMTGSWWEKDAGTLNVQAGESVVTQDQMAQIVDTASQKGLAESVRQLNNTQLQMVALLRSIADSSNRNVTAVKELNGNAWAS